MGFGCFSIVWLPCSFHFNLFPFLNLIYLKFLQKARGEDSQKLKAQSIKYKVKSSAKRIKGANTFKDDTIHYSLPFD